MRSMTSDSLNAGGCIAIVGGRAEFRDLIVIRLQKLAMYIRLLKSRNIELSTCNSLSKYAA